MNCSCNLHKAAARRRGTMKILLRIERRERTTTKTGLLCSKSELNIFHRIKGMISYLDCVQPSTLRVRQSSHVKKESPRKVLEPDEEKNDCHLPQKPGMPSEKRRHRRLTKVLSPTISVEVRQNHK